MYKVNVVSIREKINYYYYYNENCVFKFVFQVECRSFLDDMVGESFRIRKSGMLPTKTYKIKKQNKLN